MAGQPFPEYQLALLHLIFVIPSEMKRSVIKSRNLSLFLFFRVGTARDVSTPLDMTKALTAAFAAALMLLAAAYAQPTPATSPTSMPSESPSPTISPSATLSPSATTPVSPTPSLSATPETARSVRISFVPPPLEGAISLGIYDQSGGLVRVLHQEAKVDEFTVGEDALLTKWDGKNDDGENLPTGKYRARGYLVGRLKVEDVGKVANAPPDFNAAATVQVKLMANPLAKDERPIISLTVGFDDENSFLQTADGLPLFTVSKQPKLVRAAITKNSEKSVDVWQDDGAAVKQLRVSNVDKMMAFDCGDFELK